jgi:serine/threonine protein kinase
MTSCNEEIDWLPDLSNSKDSVAVVPSSSEMGSDGLTLPDGTLCDTLGVQLDSRRKSVQSVPVAPPPPALLRRLLHKDQPLGLASSLTGSISSTGISRPARCRTRSKAVSVSSVSEGELLHSDKKRQGYQAPFDAIVENHGEQADFEDQEVQRLDLHNLCIGDFYDEDTLRCRHCQKKYDDADGFLCLGIDDIIFVKADPYFGQRKARTFRVVGQLGQGTFGTVVQAAETYQSPRGMANNSIVLSSSVPTSVLSNVSLRAFGHKISLPQRQFAIKIIRNVPKYRRAARKELDILQCIHTAGGKEAVHGCISLLGAFEFRHHICFIFPLLAGDLYGVLEAGHFQGLPLDQIRTIAKQLFRTADFLRQRGIIHTDLKPENIMLLDARLDLSEAPSGQGTDPRARLRRTDIQVIDFGSAVYTQQYHPELVSTRHYRAPEVILGLPWAFPIDMWSIGCILAELYTGRQIFSTHANAEHLALMAKFLGAPGFPGWMASAHQQAFQRKYKEEQHAPSSKLIRKHYAKCKLAYYL